MNTVGQVQIDKQMVASKAELIERLAELYAANNDQKILISADRETHHGDVMALLSRIRQAGFQKVAFAIKGDWAPTGDSSDSTAAPGTDVTPDASPSPSAPAAATPAASAPASAPAAPPAGQ